jgi:DNA helicase-2/ATP-dependent DNA helicase PcrA
MLLLDRNIRLNAETPFAPNIQDVAVVEFKKFNNQLEESVYVLRKSTQLVADNANAKVAVLVKQRGANIDAIINKFIETDTPYFYGLFTDDDVHYVSFHRKCLYEFIELIKSAKGVTKKLGKTHVTRIKLAYADETGLITSSMLILLEKFWERLFIDFAFLATEDKNNIVIDTFENNGLKQYIEHIDSNIIISTVHAAKGLEWDYVILPDMEEDSFPNYFGLCSHCRRQNDCNLKLDDNILVKFLEELSVFYVAVTRAKKQVYFSASELQLDKYGNGRQKRISCFMKLPGITT